MLTSLRARFPAAAKAAPGLLAAGGVASAATVVAAALPSSLHISAIPVSIVLGSTLANVGPLAQHVDRCVYTNARASVGPFPSPRGRA